MKNILIDLSVLNHQKPSGLGRFSLNLTEALIKRGNHRYSYIACRDENHPQLKKAKKIEVEIPANQTPEAQKELAFWAQDARADLVMGTQYPVPVGRKSFQSVLTIHDLIPLRLPDLYKGYQPYEFYDKFIRKNAPHADAIVTVSNSAKKDIIELFNIPSSRIHVIVEGAAGRFAPLAGSDSLWPQAKKKFNLRQPYLLSLCTFSIQKNLPRTLEAFEILKSRRDMKDVQLVLAGMAGSSEQLLIKTMREHPNRKDIVHTGYLPDALVPTLYRQAAAFVSPSLYEGFGLPMLEAMQCGTAVVTSPVSSIPEVVGDCAFNCDPYSSQSIAQAMHMALTQESLRQQKIAAGLKRAKLFSWDKAAAQVEQVFARLLR